MANYAKQPTSYYRSDDSQDDIHERPFARFVNNLAGNETRDQSEYNPRKY